MPAQPEFDVLIACKREERLLATGALGKGVRLGDYAECAVPLRVKTSNFRKNLLIGVVAGRRDYS